MTTIKCPVCLEELEIDEVPEEKTSGCALCGKKVTAFVCPICFSEFNLVHSGAPEICEI